MPKIITYSNDTLKALHSFWKQNWYKASRTDYAMYMMLVGTEDKFVKSFNPLTNVNKIQSSRHPNQTIISTLAYMHFIWRRIVTRPNQVFGGDLCRQMMDIVMKDENYYQPEILDRIERLHNKFDLTNSIPLL